MAEDYAVINAALCIRTTTYSSSVIEPSTTLLVLTTMLASAFAVASKFESSSNALRRASHRSFAGLLSWREVRPCESDAGGRGLRAIWMYALQVHLRDLVTLLTLHSHRVRG